MGSEIRAVVTKPESNASEVESRVDKAASSRVTEERSLQGWGVSPVLLWKISCCESNVNCKQIKNTRYCQDFFVG